MALASKSLGAFVLITAHLLLPSASLSQSYPFNLLSRGFCEDLIRTTRDEARSEFENNYSRAMAYFDISAMVEAAVERTGAFNCSDLRVGICMQRYAQNGADGLYSTIKCWRQETRRISNYQTPLTERQLLDKLNNHRSELGCIEKVWILDRQDWGTARRACNL